MMTDFQAVEINIGYLIHRLEMQKHTPAVKRRRNGNHPPIMKYVVFANALSDARKLRLNGKRNQNALSEGGREVFGFGDLELPWAV